MNLGKLNKHFCYLAGPIDEADDFGVGWRKELTKFLHSLGVGVFNPCDKPIVGSSEDSVLVEKVKQMKKEGDWESARYIMRKCISDDLYMLDLSNFVVLYINRDIHMAGSYIEASYAALEKKPVFVFCEQGLEAIPNSVLGIISPVTYFSSLPNLKSYLAGLNDGLIQCSKFRFIDYSKVLP